MPAARRALPSPSGRRGGTTIAPADSVAGPQRLTYLVKQLQEAMRARLDHITQQFGLTPKQYTALSVLAEHPRTSSANLARLTFVTPQAANEMVATLEAKGFLARSVDHENRRRRSVVVTRAGHSALTRCDVQVDQLERFVFHSVGRAEEMRFRRTLQVCLDTLTDAGGP